MPNLIADEYKNFEDIKKLDANGNEYWTARELATVLQYSQWRNLQKL